MNESALLAFQMEEVISAVKFIACGALFTAGVALWLHAKFWRKNEDN